MVFFCRTVENPYSSLLRQALSNRVFWQIYCIKIFFASKK
jgi:hypothetical protein